MDYYFVEWEYKDSNFRGRSPYSFPEWRALDLVESGNKYFKRAFHYLGRKDVRKTSVHPQYKEVDYV